jgi:hypothetical protein
MPLSTCKRKALARERDRLALTEMKGETSWRLSMQAQTRMTTTQLATIDKGLPMTFDNFPIA